MLNTLRLLVFYVYILTLACNNSDDKGSTLSTQKKKHHLNIPEGGIESIVEANTQKIIEGTDGSIILTVGEVMRNKASISVKRDNTIVEEHIVEENSSMSFDYDGTPYTIELKKVKKPLIGAGKVEIVLR